MTMPSHFPDDPTCQQVIEFLMQYLEGELSHKDRAEFDKHLGLCPSCVNYLESYRSTIMLGKMALCDHTGEAAQMPKELMSAVRGAMKKHNSR